MKTDNSSPVSDTLNKVLKIEDRLAQLKKLADASAATLTDLERTVDLADDEALAKVSRLQTIQALIPNRQASANAELEAAQSDLLQACHSFVSGHLGPRSRTMMKAVQAKMADQLKPHFREGFELDQAVANSNAVMELEGIQWRTLIEGNPPHGVVEYANRVLQANQDADALEKKYLN